MMPTLITTSNEDRPTGKGFEGKGPSIDLPTMASSEPEPLRITVTPDRSKVQDGPAVPDQVSEQVGLEDAAGPPVPTAVQSAQPTDNHWKSIQDALAQGYSRQEIGSYLQQTQKMNPDDADKQIIDSVQDKIKAAQAQGYNDDEIKDYLIQNKYDGNIVDSAIKSAAIPKPWKKYEWDPNTPKENAKDISDLYLNIHQKYSTTAKEVGGLFNEQMGIEARREINDLNLSLVDKLKENKIDAYIDPHSGDLMMRDENGQESEVGTSFINSLYNSKGEMAGAIAGGWAGMKAGSKAPLRLRPFTVAAGLLAGGAFGASIGKGADIAINSSIIKDDIEAKLYMTQMKEAGIFDAVTGIVGVGVFKAGAMGVKGIMKSYDYVLAGNTKGALKILKDNLHISDDQATDITDQFLSKLNNPPTRNTMFRKNIPLNSDQAQILAISSTQQGAENLVKQATSHNLKVSTTILKSIDQRSKDLAIGLKSATNENLGSLMRNDIKSYRDDVKGFYGAVKKIGADAIDGTDFRFDLEKIAISPVMENISKKVSDPMMRDNFISYASRIEAASQDRTFSGLIDLRQSVNDFKHSKTGLSTPDLEALNTVINKIDGQMNKAVKTYMPDNAKEWTSQFGRAKKEYAIMKQLEENAIYTAVTSKKASEAQIRRALNKYGNDLDVDAEVFNNIIGKMAPSTRVKVEGAAINNLFNKYTYGKFSEVQATNFPALSDAIRSLNITTPEGKRLTGIIDDISKVFKNDENLSGVSGNLSVSKFANSLSSDLRQKAWYSIISEVWNTLKTLAPGRRANSAALIKQLGKVLENPLNFKTVEDLVRNIPKESQDEMRSLIKELQIETAKNPKKPPRDFVNMYKQTKSGQMVKSDGALGKGVYLVDSVKNPNPELKVMKHEVNMSKMATLNDISNLVGTEVTEKQIKAIPNLAAQLQKKGFIGIRVEGKAMLFPETTVGVRSSTKTVKSALGEAKSAKPRSYSAFDDPKPRKK